MPRIPFSFTSPSSTPTIPRPDSLFPYLFPPRHLLTNPLPTPRPAIPPPPPQPQNQRPQPRHRVAPASASASTPPYWSEALWHSGHTSTCRRRVTSRGPEGEGKKEGAGDAPGVRKEGGEDGGLFCSTYPCSRWRKLLHVSGKDLHIGPAARKGARSLNLR